MENGGGRGWKFWAIVGGIGSLVVFALIVWGLYSLGAADQSALERLRDIAVIFVVLLFLITVILLAAITAALGYLVLAIKNEAIPTLHELNATVKRFRGTAEFVTEEAVKPILTVAGAYARMRATMKTVAGKNSKQK
jgi:hypothetical protein